MKLNVRKEGGQLQALELESLGNFETWTASSSPMSDF